MKNHVRVISLSILAASLLVACGGGGGGGTPAAGTPPAGTPSIVTPPPAAGGTPTTAAALTAISTQLTTFQNLFATAAPGVGNATFAGLFDATFMHDGVTKAAFLVNTTGAQGFPIGGVFSAPVGVVSLDAGAVPNDATHQWFATALTGSGSNQYFTMLAIKNAAGQWLIAGNQRQVGTRSALFAQQNIVPAAGVAPATVTFSSGLDLSLQLDNVGGAGLDAALLAKGVTLVTVTGPGVIGATANTAGAATIFNSVASGGMARSQQLAPCGGAITTNCVNKAAVVPGTYSYAITGTAPGVGGVAFTYTYNDKVTATLPATFTAANFPVINPASTQFTAYISGAVVTINWTVPAAQTANGADWFGTLSTGTNLNLWVNATGGPGAVINSTTTLPAFAPATLVSGQISAQSMDAQGITYRTTM